MYRCGQVIDFARSDSHTGPVVVPLVHSVSWGPAEEYSLSDVGAACTIPSGSSFVYERRVDLELIKFGLKGWTTVFAAGDAGASCNPMYGSCKYASPVWPAASPFGLAVGGTIATKAGGVVHEVALDVLMGASITTGGGFSYFDEQPPFQREAVANFLRQRAAEHPLPAPDFFEFPDKLKPQDPPRRTPVYANRALPDVSAVAEALYMVRGGEDTQSATGVSFATPIWAGVVSLINNARLNAGLPAMGAIAPFLYWAASVNRSAFNDIVEGGNRCFETPEWTSNSTVNDSCCADGFWAGPGFDVVTGLGTPNVRVLLELAVQVGHKAVSRRAQAT